jgi:hypothetical protein
MSAQRNEFCRIIKKRYPAISAKADTEYSHQWGDFTDSEYYSYTWFEALANALNGEMRRDVSASEYSELFSSISANFESGDDDVKKCIDVSFVENLFWQVPERKSASYWHALPKNLQELYFGFHHRTPL